ncbi:hypothetical protein [Larkinella sp. C7]|jgi:hypothetical protein|uniref:hypothetical protein n=1 Tax=Larkinella sp. C7 TaxID=2576607 RepID=UPI00111116CB|nr:hypothetical protein [Larkinella sp. C7]
MILQKPDLFPDLVHYLKNQGVDPECLQNALDSYLWDAGQLIQEEYDYDNNPLGYIQATEYKEAVLQFRDVLTLEIDD